MFDIADLVNGFHIEVEGREIFINGKCVRNAIDEISFRLMPLQMLPYIPATISPGWTSKKEDYLEHPLEVVEEYRKQGATHIIGELKHMGSRAVMIVFDNEETAMEYTSQKDLVVIYSRNGRRFFNPSTHELMSTKIRGILNKVDYFKKHDTRFAIYDTEILPWNTKGQGLLNNQYLPVLDGAMGLNKKIQENMIGCSKVRKEILEEVERNIANTHKFKEQLENYCWDTNVEGIKIAPFHLLAHENRTYFNRAHTWHLAHFEELISAGDLFVETPHIVVDVNDEDSIANAVRFWEDITAQGYEGVMFKSFFFFQKNKEGELIIPMLKVRGKDYLRIIYGINYDSSEILNRLKRRSTKKKRALHYQEMLLGAEGLRSFVTNQPQEEWQKYVFATICLANERTDHRL